jgi:predicted exporter
VLAYSAQGIAPFPGLRQMAFFSAIGLIGGWLTVVCWMPILLKKKHPYHFPTLIQTLKNVREAIPTINTAIVRHCFILLTVVSIIIVMSTSNTDDVRSLQTSSTTMLQQDVQIKKVLGDDNSGVYFTLEADSEQNLLELEEKFSERLYSGITDEMMSHFMATSLYIPSIKRQEDNHQLLKRNVYKSNTLLDVFLARSQLDAIKIAAQQAYSEKPIEILHPSDLSGNNSNHFASHLWLGKYQQRYYSIITLHGIPDINDKVNQYFFNLAKNNSDIKYVNRVSDLSVLLTGYKGQVIQWLLIAYLVLSLVLMARYKKSTWRIMAVPALASLFTISILVISGTAITLFHYFALLLILCFGLDTSIFLYDNEHAPHTWLAVILSTSTTLLAFGLLSLSDTPVLHYFGETILLGILLVLILSPFFAKNQQKKIPTPC